MRENRKAPDTLPSGKKVHAVLEALKRLALPALLKDRDADSPLRVWVPACATGEEVYFLTMTLLEFLEERGDSTPVKVFGTDMNDAALATARLGIYSKKNLIEIGPSRLERFFTTAGDGYQVHKAVRELCIFALQD